MMSSSLKGAICVYLLILSSGSQAVPISTNYTITALGLLDNNHTRADGHRESGVYGINKAGQILGYSDQFSITDKRTDKQPFSPGRDIWLYNGNRSVLINPTGSRHTGFAGQRKVSKVFFNEAGHVAGNANRYNNSTGNFGNLGTDAWIYDGKRTTIIGLTDAEHINPRFKFLDNNVISLNQAGQAAGFTNREGTGVDLGRSTWLYSGGSTSKIGLIDAEHTRNDGYQYGYLEGLFRTSTTLNEAGQVVGSSLRFNGAASDLGRSAWLYNASAQLKLAL